MVQVEELKKTERNNLNLLMEKQHQIEELEEKYRRLKDKQLSDSNRKMNAW